MVRSSAAAPEGGQLDQSIDHVLRAHRDCQMIGEGGTIQGQIRPGVDQAITVQNQRVMAPKTSSPSRYLFSEETPSGGLARPGLDRAAAQLGT